MTLTQLEEDGYRVVRAASVKGPRGAKRIMMLRRAKGNEQKYLCWSFDGEQYTKPVQLHL